MEQEYIAYISCRRRPLDTAVAKKTQRLIERYELPKALCKNGSQKPGSVFLDEDEEPGSSAVSENAAKALDRSRYLIVVCTPDTPLTKWCEREIKYFLKNHDRDHLLAVLAAGDPYQSFPRGLCNEYDEEGNTVREVTPITADIVSRTPRGALRKLESEYIRLAAALTERPYDTLLSSETRRRMRKFSACMCAVCALMAALTIGMFVKNRTYAAKMDELTSANRESALQNELLIRENEELREQNRKFLLSESETLAAASENALDVEIDRLKAVRLALSALTDGDGDRPYSANAERALASALYAYESSPMNWDVSVSAPDKVTEILRGPSTCALIAGEDHTLTYADMKSGEVFWSRRMDQTAEDVNPLIAVDSAGGLGYFAGGKDVLCFDLQTGGVKWKAETDGQDGAAFDCRSLYADENGAYALSVCADVLRVHRLDASDGQKTEIFSRTLENGTFSDILTALDANARRLYALDGEGVLCGFSLSGGEICSAGTQGLPLGLTAEDGRVYAVSCAENGGAAVTVTCFEGETGAEIWRTDVILPEAFDLQNGKPFMLARNNAFSVAIDRNIVSLNGRTGAVEACYAVPEKVVGQTASRGAVMYFLSNGQIEPLMWSSDAGESYGFLGANPLMFEDLSNGTFLTVIQDQPCAVKSISVIRDAHALSGVTVSDCSAYIQSPDEKYLAAKNDRTPGFVLMDAETLDVVSEWTADGAIEETYFLTTEEGKILWRDADSKIRLTDLRNGNTETVFDADGYPFIAQTPYRPGRAPVAAFAAHRQGKVFFAVIADGRVTAEAVYAQDAESADVETDSLIVGHNGYAALRAVTDGAAYEIVMKTGDGTVRAFPAAGNGSAFRVMGDTEPVLASADSDGAVRVTDAETGRVLAECAVPDANVVWMAFISEDRTLMAITDTSLIVTFDARTGELLTASKASIGFTPDTRSPVCETEETVAVWTDAGGMLIDRATMAANAVVPGMVAYSASRDSLITAQNGAVVRYPRYTTRQLIEWGRECTAERMPGA